MEYSHLSRQYHETMGWSEVFQQERGGLQLRQTSRVVVVNYPLNNHVNRMI